MAGVDGSGKQPTTRRRGRIAVALGIAGIIAAMAKLCCFTVETGEYALVTEFGKPVQVITAPGLGFKRPYQNVRTFDSRLFAYTPAYTEFLTLEKTPVVAASTVLWRISDPKKFFETVFDRVGAESRLGDILFAELGAAIGRSPLVAFVSMEPNAFRAQSILAEVSGKCREIEVRAAADREKSRILSEALKLAQQHRGEGEGKAARIYAESLSKGPEFYEFVRTMQASRNLIPKGTTLMLPADSELFGLLQDSSHYERGGANRKAAAKPRKEGTMR